MELVYRAIRESIQETGIVRIEQLDMLRAGVSQSAVLRALFGECEGDVENGSEHEYWGVDVDGNDWRVHVEVL